MLICPGFVSRQTWKKYQNLPERHFNGTTVLPKIRSIKVATYCKRSLFDFIFLLLICYNQLSTTAITNKWGNQFLDEFPYSWDAGIEDMIIYPLICFD